MPDMDGIELISLIHQIRQDLSVSIISGNSTGQYANRLTGLNWLQKPFANGEVARRVRELIARSEGCERRCQAIDETPAGVRPSHSRILAGGGTDRSYDQDER